MHDTPGQDMRGGGEGGRQIGRQTDNRRDKNNILQRGKMKTSLIKEEPERTVESVDMRYHRTGYCKYNFVQCTVYVLG